MCSAMRATLRSWAATGPDSCAPYRKQSMCGAKRELYSPCVLGRKPISA